MRLARLIAVSLALVLPVTAGLFRVWVHQDALQLGYRLSEREQARRALRNVERQLEVELAAERAPANLLALAQRLKLVPPTPQQLAGARLARNAGGGRGGR